jgi:DNA-binding MarR family transcriptional regulator
LSTLEHPEDGDPTPTELAHLQRIEKHLRESPWHSASFAEIRGLLGVSPGRVSQLVKKLEPQRFEVKRSAADHKARVLVLKRRSQL